MHVKCRPVSVFFALSHPHSEVSQFVGVLTGSGKVEGQPGFFTGLSYAEWCVSGLQVAWEGCPSCAVAVSCCVPLGTGPSLPSSALLAAPLRRG